MGASALQHCSSPACECFRLFRRVKSSQDKSRQVKFKFKFKSSQVRCGALGFPLPSFPVLTPSYKSPLLMSHLTHI